MKKNSFSRLLKLIFFLSIGFFSIWWFLNKLSPEEKTQIWTSIKEANYKWLLLAMSVGFISHFVRALRWNMLIEPLGHKPKNIDTFAAVAVGYIGNFIIPRFGEFARCASLNKTSKVPFSALFGTVIVERIFDMLVFMILFIIGLWFFVKQLSDYASGFLYTFINGFSQKKLIFLGLIVLIGIIGLFFIYYFRKKLRNYIFFGKIIDLLTKFRSGLLSMLKMKNWPLFIFYTVFIWVCYFFMTWLCFFALKETLDLPVSAAFAALAFGTVGIIVVQGGIGVYPAIIAETLVLFSVSYAFGYAMGWLIWLAQTVLLLAIGFWAFIYLSFNKKFSLNDIKPN